MCDKTCIFFFFPIINKYLCMAKRSLLSRCPSHMVGRLVLVIPMYVVSSVASWVGSTYILHLSIPLIFTYPQTLPCHLVYCFTHKITDWLFYVGYKCPIPVYVWLRRNVLVQVHFHKSNSLPHFTTVCT